MTLVVFSMGLLPLIVLFQSSHKSTAKAKNLMIAQSIGRSKVDEIRAMGYMGIKKQMATLSDSGWRPVAGKIVPDDPDSPVYPDVYSKFKTKLTVDNRGPSTNKFLVYLSVKWTEPQGEQELTFGTVVVRYGPR